MAFTKPRFTRTKKPFTRRLSSKVKSKLALRKNIKMSIGSSKRAPIHFHVIHSILDISGSPNEDYTYAYPINPTQSPRWNVYKQLYDSYRVMSVIFDFIPKVNMAQTVFNNVANKTAQWQNGITFLKYDKDDGVAPATVAQCILENYADRPSMKRFRYSVKVPKLMQTNDNNQVNFGYHSCDPAGPTPDDGYLKFYVSTENDDINVDAWRTGYNVVVKYLVAFKDYTSVITGEEQGPKAKVITI